MKFTLKYFYLVIWIAFYNPIILLTREEILSLKHKCKVSLGLLLVAATFVGATHNEWSAKVTLGNTFFIQNRGESH